MKVKRYTALEVDEVSFVTAGANQPAFVRLFKSRDREKNEMKNTETPKPEAKKEEVVTPPAQPSAEEIEKSVRAKLEKEFAEKLEAESKKRQELEKSIKLRDKVEYTKTTLKCVPGDANTLAEKLVDLESKDAELAKFVQETLKSCSELIDKSALLEQHSKGGKADQGNSALEKAQAMAAEKVKANPAMSLAKAEAEVWKENPSLYQQYREEKQAA